MEVGYQRQRNAPHIFDRGRFDKSSSLKRILITRPEPGASQTAARLTALGLTPIVASVLSIVPRPIVVPAHVAATVLTSGNAIPACPESLHSRPAFAVGSATARRAVEAGFVDVRDADGDAVKLAKLVAATLSPSEGTLLLPAALGQGIDLASTLRAKGFKVFRRVAYQAQPVACLPEPAAAALQRGDLTGITFFSGETARHFVRLVRAAGLSETVRNVEAVSISERTAVALRGLPWRRVRIAAKPNQDSMLVLLQ